MIGRNAEIALLSGLIAESRAGQSRAVVVHGEAGIGKSVLLAEIAGRGADDLRVLRAIGVEAEAELPFAALHLLLLPARHLIVRLPATQRQALHRAFGEEEGPPPDRFLVGLAVLTLLADLAEERPLLCLVDDVHWVDRASLDALLFAARRLAAERITMIFAGRDEHEPAAHGLANLRLSALSRADCERLLAERAAELSPHERDRVIEDADGNPLALLHFAANLTVERQSGQPGLSAAKRLEQSLRTAIRGLPDRTRLLLLVAAAEGSGDLRLVLKAAQALGAGPEDLASAEDAALIEVSDDRLRFHHPLIKAAAHQEAPVARRAAVHRALADLLDGDDQADRRAWHLSAAALGPDETLSAVLAATGKRAQARGGLAAAANAYERAAQLTVEPELRARWLAAAAEAALDIGRLSQAAAVTERGRRLTTDPVLLARLAHVRAAVDSEQGDPATAAHTLISAAANVAPAVPSQAASLLATAAGEAWFAGDHDALRQIADLISTVESHLVPVATAVHGMERVAAGDPAAGLPLLRAALPVDRTAATDRVTGTWAVFSALMTGDDDAACELAATLVDACRDQGHIGALAHALQLLTQARILRGRYAEAAESGAEAWQIAHDTGQAGRLRYLHGILARLAAIRGEDDECRRLAGLAEGAVGERHGTGWGRCALALLDLVRAGNAAAADRIAQVLDGPLGHTVIATFTIADHVEACARLNEPARASTAFSRFEAWAAASGQPWAAAVVHRCRALLAPPGEAETHYRAALDQHARGGRPFEQARTRLLYGEWLRRTRRRADARAQLGAALEEFAALGATPWAERTQRELVATGTRLAVPDSQSAALHALTPQELQVVRLAATGATNRQIGAQLFLSPRTVGSHLYRAYPKLGVSSREELADIDLGSAAHR
ncbi:AAA family ATPase [Lentzea sp. BCCO 10_0856]|uniref:AAA family ATPase n=1 Tax=Lentzea miocenica TaxID=3095431 RepID=A0ABU4SZJ6_9PSEU|nr:AAA family ATPase [Lentzea sp. BCCO 10_0856]MDX8031331.1 AAA family ATPase [Lentzea sp. BCCO 10_0856]